MIHGKKSKGEYMAIEDTESGVDVLDNNYPLMVRLKVCPGTYAHSKNVAFLMEAVGSELGLDITSLRIAGFYHDIGKTLYPSYFIENQTEETGNPHDNLPPHISYRIIASHPSETANILVNDPNISRKIVQWCSQHHGTTIMQFFYKKAESKNPENYRYRNTSPQSLEAGILMVCDHLEAKCRSLYQANKLTSIKDVVDETMDQITLEDKQWDDISLTYSHIRRLKEVLYNELASMYKPKRIDYYEVPKTTQGSGTGQSSPKE